MAKIGVNRHLTFDPHSLTIPFAQPQFFLPASGTGTSLSEDANMADLFREITYRLQELRAERFAINREIAQVEEDLQEEVLRNLSLQTKILNSLTTSEILNALRRADSKIQDDFTAKPDWATKKPAPEKVA